MSTQEDGRRLRSRNHEPEAQQRATSFLRPWLLGGVAAHVSGLRTYPQMAEFYYMQNYVSANLVFKEVTKCESEKSESDVKPSHSLRPGSLSAVRGTSPPPLLFGPLHRGRTMGTTC